jgi:hypothetical protein
MYNGMQDFACIHVFKILGRVGGLDFEFGPAEVSTLDPPSIWTSRSAISMWILLAPCTSFRAGHRGCPDFAGLQPRGRQLCFECPDFRPILRRICTSGTHDRPISDTQTHTSDGLRPGSRLFLNLGRPELFFQQVP